jgi:hypothetical protein
VELVLARRRAHLRRRASREDLQRSVCLEDSFSGELQHRFRVLWEGFSIRASSWQRASVQWFWQLVRRAHHPRAHLLHLDLCFSLVQAAIVSGSSVYCTCCIPPSFLHIYTLRFQTGFPRGGFIQGHVDQKYLCSFSCMLVFRTTLFQL